jgi:hypothetical protein
MALSAWVGLNWIFIRCRNGVKATVSVGGGSTGGGSTGPGLSGRGTISFLQATRHNRAIENSKTFFIRAYVIKLSGKGYLQDVSKDEWAFKDTTLPYAIFRPAHL